MTFKTMLVTLSLFFTHTVNAEIGMASWYGGKFHGRRTASGSTFNTHAYTAAHNRLPFGTKVRVINLANLKSCVVTITDRGGFTKYGRIIDLSHRAKTAIGMGGVAKVKLEIVR